MGVYARARDRGNDLFRAGLGYTDGLCFQGRFNGRGDYPAFGPVACSGGFWNSRLLPREGHLKRVTVVPFPGLDVIPIRPQSRWHAAACLPDHVRSRTPKRFPVLTAATDLVHTLFFT